jgi:low temperature requirement protein LtrA
MATPWAAELLRKPGQPQRATFLELFFDLVFVFALTRVSQRLVEDVTSQRRIVLTEAGQTMVLLLALLMVWFVTAVITDLYDPERPEIQLLVVGTMLGSLVMAAVLPQAFGPWGPIFVGAYVAIHLGRGLFLVPALRGHPAQRRAAQVLFWFTISAVPWIAGALFPESVARGVLWTVAVAVDYTGYALRWPTPKLGRTPVSELPVVPEHLTERYRQFVIIALGELILETGAAYSQSGFAAGSNTAFVVSFATTALLWRIYIYRAGEQLPEAIAKAREPARLARLSVPAHLLMIAGIVVIAPGIELVITHPLGHTDPAWKVFILGGPALFLAGRAAIEYMVFGRISRSRLIGVLVLVAISPAARFLPPLAVAAAPALVLAGIAVSDAVRAKRRPSEPPTPPR